MTATPDARRVVAITGAGGALGSAISARLAGEPTTDLVLSDVSDTSLDATVAALPDARGGVATQLADVSDPGQVEALVKLAVERFGRLDALISNAGVLSPNGRIHNLATEDWERAFRINVLGAVNGITAAVGVMRPQKAGSIVLTASVSGLTAWSHAAPYCATKAAVIQLAKVAAVEYARDGIRVNAIIPGNVQTPRQMKWYTPEGEAEIVAAQCLDGRIQPSDIAAMALFLASDDARFCTAHNYWVDAGWR